MYYVRVATPICVVHPGSSGVGPALPLETARVSKIFKFKPGAGESSRRGQMHKSGCQEVLSELLEQHAGKRTDGREARERTLKIAEKM